MLKRVIGYTALLLFLAGAPLAAQAQAPTIGYTNQQALLANMPEAEDVQQQLRQEAQQAQQALIQQQEEFRNMLEEYQQQRSLLSEEARAEREQELQQMQIEIQQAAIERDRALAQREAELLQPLLEELQTAINAVAEQRGLSVVIRSQSLLYADEEQPVNITREVAQRLGIEVEEQPPAPTVDDGVN